MATKAPPTPKHAMPAGVYMPNALDSLRLLSVWIDAQGHAVTNDAAILGWLLDPNAPGPTPIRRLPHPQRGLLHQRHYPEGHGRAAAMARC